MGKPLVSVIVCTHLAENRKYLDACLRSLELQEGVDFEVILMSSDPHPEGLSPLIRHYKCDGDMGWTKKIIAGVSLADHDSKYFLLLNDDVILSKHAVATLAKNAADFAVILNPMSNCDNGWLYHAQFNLDVGGKTVPLKQRFYEWEEVEGLHEAIHNYPKGQRILINATYVCFYSTLIPRNVWNMVGGVDPKFVNGYEDQDFCLRARDHKVHSLVDAESFVFHFGGATSEKTVLPADALKNENYFKSKWGLT